MKKRTLTISLIVLAIMLLVGIGYAGWVISSTTASTEVGNFTAYGVSDTGVLEVTKVENQNVIFGKPTTNPLPAANWLSVDNEVDTENLTVQFKLKWSGGAATFSLVCDAYKEPVSGDPISKTLDAKLIAAPVYDFAGDHTGASISGTTLTITNDYQANTELTITVRFNWGTSFASQNPYTYFNGTTASATPDISVVTLYNSETSNQALASAALTALDNLIKPENGSSALKFKVTVTKTA